MNVNEEIQLLLCLLNLGFSLKDACEISHDVVREEKYLCDEILRFIKMKEDKHESNSSDSVSLLTP